MAFPFPGRASGSYPAPKRCFVDEPACSRSLSFRYVRPVCIRDGGFVIGAVIADGVMLAAETGDGT